ncbi:MAG: LytR/AlgR family response regulator transcription factor [Anaerovoracaceae bacterium]|jgi:two-component system response regulator LytT
MHIIICDDDQSIIREYTNLLEKLDKKYDLQLKVSGYISGEKLLFELPENPNAVDLIYMDIHFGNKMNGMETAKTLRDSGYANEIVFLTVDRGRVFESFDVDPLHYFIKEDIGTEKFEEVLLKAKKRVDARQEEVLTLTCAGETRNIPLKNIHYFEVVQRIITVHYEGETFEFYSTMGKLENLLTKKGFVRIHRAYIAAFRQIASMKNNEVVMRDGTRLPVGRTYSKSLRKKMGS